MFGRLLHARGEVERELADNLLGKRPHLVADQDQLVDVRVEHRRREARVQRAAMLAKLAHRAEHGDAAFDVLLRAEALQGRGHRRRIGVVAFVDQQHFAAVDLDLVTLVRDP